MVPAWFVSLQIAAEQTARSGGPFSPYWQQLAADLLLAIESNAPLLEPDRHAAGDGSHASDELGPFDALAYGSVEDVRAYALYLGAKPDRARQMADYVEARYQRRDVDVRNADGLKRELVADIRAALDEQPIAEGVVVSMTPDQVVDVLAAIAAELVSAEVAHRALDAAYKPAAAIEEVGRPLDRRPD